MGGKVLHLIVFVGDVKDRVFHVQFFHFSGLGFGYVDFKFVLVLLKRRDNQQQAD